MTRPPRRGGPAPVWPPFSRLALGAGLTIAIIAAAMVLVDPRSTSRVQALPEWVVLLFHSLTDLGLYGVVLFPTGFALLALALAEGPWLGRPARATLSVLSVRIGFVFAAVAVPGLVIGIVKRLIGRARPFVEGNDPFNYVRWGWQNDYASFPSGHSTSAFSIAMALGAIWPRARPYLWAYAATIALSRVIVSAHYPSDVLAGALCGTLGALLMRHWFAVRRLGFVVEADGGVAVKPGPSRRRVQSALNRFVGRGA